MSDEFYQELADKWDLELFIIRKGDKFCQANGEDTYENASWSAGDTIYLGFYDDPELKLISFFHEAGHFHNRKRQYTSMYFLERDAWTSGYKLATGLGICFSKKARDWADSQLATYGWD